MKVIVSGGGTGGHIFPAISIANAIREIDQTADILFVGAEGRMEMERVPQAGYPIKGLPVAGFDRKNLLRNIAVLWKLWKSQRMARKIIREFKPDVCVGVGGYASGPTLKEAQKMGIPTLIQEQNSYPGVTNKLLARNASRICVAYDGLERFFPADKIIKTGNPVRQSLINSPLTREEARRQLGIKGSDPLILIIGGSLGARTINEAVLHGINQIKQERVQILWQTGKYYYEQIRRELVHVDCPDNLKAVQFVEDMATAYAAADLVVSRAGASSISELCLLGKPAILVPSPNVAEDHQTKNARALSDRGAAIMISDADARQTLISKAVATVIKTETLASLSTEISKLALRDSANVIAREVMSLAGCTDNEIQSVYFVGIGGIGMSAIARYFMQRGLFVAGYDRTPSDLTRKMEQEGALIHYDDTVDAIPEQCRDPRHTLVVYTPAIPDTHSEMAYFRSGMFNIQKRAQVLGLLTHSLKGLCVAGTHGKTTTSSMVAHLLHESPIKCNAFLGGITKNYGTNYLLSESSPYVVIEADEYDRSFHHLTPFATVITATDSDHLDIYGTREAYLESFNHYSSLVQSGGVLIMHSGLEMKARPQQGVKVYTYGRSNGDFHARNIRIGNGEIIFDYISPLGNIADVQLGVPVSINIDNGIAAMALAQVAGVDDEDIKKAMSTFKGVDRRFDFHVKTASKVYLSDYAHHPEEIRQSIISVRELYADKHITAIFQPHLYTRTRDFYHEFADALSLLDEVVLVDIYPAREEPIPGVTSQLIYDNLRPDIKRSMITKSQILTTVREMETDVLITLGAGDIDDMAAQITEIVSQKASQN